ncbi:hypothetical protein ALO_02471 [Acetonema longum DSM 6540]|uniref:Uncharacterized protein n=1 Tax=Acetonema longum DSM 6540 TaxID=1009370 RepID=F7NEN1_9FIRM|nr:hypothetical protein ALO_02471 [Acetonema longum DSM 6540]
MLFAMLAANFPAETLGSLLKPFLLLNNYDATRGNPAQIG